MLRRQLACERRVFNDVDTTTPTQYGTQDVTRAEASAHAGKVKFRRNKRKSLSLVAQSAPTALLGN